MSLLSLGKLLMVILLGIGTISAQKRVEITKHIEDHGDKGEYLGYKLKDVVSDSAKLFGIPDKIEYWLPKKVVYTYLTRTDSTDLEVKVSYDISELNGKFYRLIEVMQHGYQIISDKPYVGFPKIK